MRFQKHSPFGFTLIEMLIALVMAGAVVTPLYIITRGVAEQTGSKQLEIEAMQRARIGMDTLIRDFSRVGLFASPNTAVDARLLNRDINASTARYRLALAHLNPGSSGPDTVLLSGNFLGSRVYHAFAQSPSDLVITDSLQNTAECTAQFDPAYAFARISDNAGRELEARITGASQTTSGCLVTINGNDRDERAFKMGDPVLIAASQTAVYTVEGDTLVRYFASYTSPSVATASNCTPSTGSTDVTTVGRTRRVIANYVEDFQVWFRAVTDSNGWAVPHYPPVADVAKENGDDKNFADGMVPLPDQEIILLNPSDSPPSDGSGTCAALQNPDKCVGPEHIRSAMIRLTVRTEMSDGTLRRLPDDEASRMEKRVMAPDMDTPTATGDDPFAYMLRSMTTEVEMPNLTARGDLL